MTPAGYAPRPVPVAPTLRSGASPMTKALATMLLVVLTGRAAAPAQQPRLRPVDWSLAMLSDVRGGDTGVAGVAALRARIEPGWHLYSLT